MKEYAKGFYHSKEWKRVSRLYMESRNYVCERCGNVAVICHHKTYINPHNITDPSITLNPDNLECLCQECHNKEHNKSKKNPTGVAFDEYAVYASEFEGDLQWLQKNGYTTITTAQLVEYLSGKGSMPEKPVILTIDDGKYGVYKRAWPLLKQYKMKATLSLIGYEIDDASNAPEARIKSDAPYCTWTEIAEMQESGEIELISHTDKLHYYRHDGRVGANTKAGDTLATFLPIAQKDFSDITRSFRSYLHTTPVAMAYPYSDRSELADEAWLKSGYKLLYGGNYEDIRIDRSNFFIQEAGLNKKSAVLRRVARMTGKEFTHFIDY